MQCTNPVWLSLHKLNVPCGKCMACRIAHAREWSTRLMHELGYHEDSIFLTLTYSPECLPLDNSLHKDELQRFWKRLRKALGDRSIKYYACGEYGDAYGRPHYHAIVFGISLKKADQELIQKCWPLGFIKSGTVTYDSARYVSDYVQKKYSGKKARDVYENRQIPFQLQSKGLGKEFALENQEYLDNKLGCTIRGSEVGLPRYYKKILAIDKERIIAKAQKIKAEQNNLLAKKCANDPEKMLLLKYDSSVQNQKTLLASLAMKKKGVL